MQQSLLTLEEQTHRHPQLKDRRVASVAVAHIEGILQGARWIGSGSFCSVWTVPCFSIRNSPAHGLPVVSRSALPGTAACHLQQPSRVRVSGSPC